MKRELRGYRSMAAYAVLLVSCGVASGLVLAKGIYPYLVLLVPVIGIAVFRMGRIYMDSVRRMTFMFNAIDNDDYAFRFYESPLEVDDTMLNTALNRIKEILASAKIRAVEKERYYELIMDCARTGIITLNDAGSVYQANGEALRIFGMQRITHVNQLIISAPEAGRIMQTISAGEKHRVSCINEAGEMSLALSCSEITVEKRRLRVVVVSDINNEMSEKEIESWQKLTRILTHEIMNSLSPITSLSDTLLRIEGKNADVTYGLSTISSTSKRLLAFVENFRRFTKIPDPHKSPVEVRSLVGHAVALAESRGVSVDVDIDPADTMIYADETLVGQVVVNLLKNAREALGSRCDGKIWIRSRIDEQENVVVDICNNGGAIPAEILENIFTPFYTTKTDGSGIGLSVSRRIMQLHNGSLRLTCNTDSCVAFTLVFG